MATMALTAISAAPSKPKPTIIFAFMRTAIFAALFMTCAGPAVAQLERLTQRDALAGLKAALERSAHAAVATLGRADGFLANPQVRIALPESLQRSEKMARRLGFGTEVDELVVALNPAG